MTRVGTPKLLITIVLLSIALSHRAVAEDESNANARRRYELGRQSFDAGRFAEAALEFEAAYRAVPHGVALIMAADAWERAGQLAQAADAWSGVPNASGVTPEQRAHALLRTNTLERLLGTVMITSAEPVDVHLEDSVARVTPARLHSAPGNRVVVALLYGRESKTSVRLALGKVVTLDLSPVIAARQRGADAKAATITPQPDARSANSWWTLRRSFGVGLVTAGTAGLALGAGFGFAATETKRKFDQRPSAELQQTGISQVRWANVGFIGGGALSLAGAVCLIWPQSPRIASTAAQARLRLSSRELGITVDGHF